MTQRRFFADSLEGAKLRGDPVHHTKVVEDEDVWSLVAGHRLVECRREPSCRERFNADPIPAPIRLMTETEWHHGVGDVSSMWRANLPDPQGVARRRVRHQQHCGSHRCADGQ
jgi:hypothetical protein